LEDIINIINQAPKDPQNYYNNLRSITREERTLRLDLTFGLSQRRGPFWESHRKFAVKDNYLGKVKDIILGKRKDLESRMSWHWHHIYVRTCMAAGVDMSDWEFPDISAADRQMAMAFFEYNRARNNYIKNRPWPGYSKWLQEHQFNNLTNQEVLAKLNPQFFKER
jgi:hypothetical protein